MADDDGFTPDQREISRLDSDIDKVVVSDRRRHARVRGPARRLALRRIGVRELDGSENLLVRYEVRPGNA